MRPSNRRRKNAMPSTCVRADDTPLLSFADIVRDYRKRFTANHQRGLDYFAACPSLDDAVTKAALAKNPEGKRSAHQRRLKQAVLERSRRRLVACDFRACKSFDELFTMVHEAIGGISGIGSLTVYDTTLKIGSFLNLEPKRVYLHSGTRIGARPLLDVRGRDTIEVTELPKPFRTLAPHQIEDCLCIYKDEIAQIVRQNGST